MPVGEIWTFEISEFGTNEIGADSVRNVLFSSGKVMLLGHDQLYHFYAAIRKNAFRQDGNIGLIFNDLRVKLLQNIFSFGSQSDKGMYTREIMMTFLYTARTR